MIISRQKKDEVYPPDKQREYNIYKMTYDEVRQFDVGSIGNKDFPQQQKMKAVKPLLKDVFTEIAKFARENKMPAPHYNIEIKTEGPNGDNVYHPTPDVFAKLVYDELRADKMEKNVIVQSFDIRALQAMRKLSKTIPLSLLVSNRDGVLKNLETWVSILRSTALTTCSLTPRWSRNVANAYQGLPWTVNGYRSRKMKP